MPKNKFFQTRISESLENFITRRITELGFDSKQKARYFFHLAVQDGYKPTAEDVY